MASRNRELLRSALLLFGSFAFGYNASIVLHELGHAAGYWLTGGTVEHIIIHPFSWSRCIGSSVSAYPGFTTWAGVLFGTLMGLLLVVGSWRWRSPFAVLPIMTGVVSCIHNGLYLVYDCLAHTGGDANILVLYGTPRALVIAVGLLMVGVGVILGVMCLPLIGIRPSDGIKSRSLVLFGGLLPYGIAEFVYDLLYDRQGLGEWVAYWVIIIAVIVLVAVLTRFVMPRLRWFGRVEGRKVTWLAVGIANAGAFIILSVIFVLLIPHRPTVTTKHVLGYYDAQSNFAGVTRIMTHNPTASPDKLYESESVVFWNWQGRAGQIMIPVSGYFATICQERFEVIVVTMQGLVVVSMNERVHRWAFQEEGLLLLSRWAVSSDARKVLVYGYDSNVGEPVLIALDISSGRKTRFKPPESPSEIVFIDDNTAVASVAEDLIKVELAESGEHLFSVELGAERKGEVEAVYRGELVFHSPTFWTDENADEHVIECGDVRVPFTDPVSFVFASESWIWAIDINGKVHKVNSDGSKFQAGDYAREQMIGRGVLGDSLWIAFCDGTVRVLGGSEACVKIALPQTLRE
jgi:hypothetical protein